MKKTLWALSALALIGFGFTGCNNNCEADEDCEEGQFCIESSGGVDSEGEEIEAGEMICSDCAIECGGDTPVCVARVHACAANETCPDGLDFEKNGNFAVCKPVDLKACDSDGKCEEGYVCGEDNFCRLDTTPRYKFVRIDDLSDPGKSGWDPGADIDAVVLDGNIYATEVIEFKRADSASHEANRHFAANPKKILGKPDSLVSYPNTGSCNYFQSTSNSGGNKKCDLDATKGVADDACDYEYSFVSLGGKGGHIIVEMGGEIKANSKIDVIELGDCALANTAGGSTNKANAEEMEVFISVSKDATGDQWKAIGSRAATGGIASFTVSGNIL